MTIRPKFESKINLNENILKSSRYRDKYEKFLMWVSDGSYTICIPSCAGGWGKCDTHSRLINCCHLLKFGVFKCTLVRRCRGSSARMAIYYNVKTFAKRIVLTSV